MCGRASATASAPQLGSKMRIGPSASAAILRPLVFANPKESRRLSARPLQRASCPPLARWHDARATRRRFYTCSCLAGLSRLAAALPSFVPDPDCRLIGNSPPTGSGRANAARQRRARRLDRDPCSWVRINLEPVGSG